MLYGKSFRLALSAMTAVILCSLMSARSNAQSIEKLELVLAPPTYNTDRHDGYYYEVRGNLYPKETAFDCDNRPAVARVGTYRIGVSWGGPAEFQAVMLVALADKRQVLWQGYFKFDPNEDGAEFSWSYEGIILHSDKQILADFALLSKLCFGGKLIVYFLN